MLILTCFSLLSPPALTPGSPVTTQGQVTPSSSTTLPLTTSATRGHSLSLPNTGSLKKASQVRKRRRNCFWKKSCIFAQYLISERDRRVFIVVSRYQSPLVKPVVLSTWISSLWKLLNLWRTWRRLSRILRWAETFFISSTKSLFHRI